MTRKPNVNVLNQPRRVPAPVDALLLGGAAPSGDRGLGAGASTPDASTLSSRAADGEIPPIADDPPPSPAVTPEPANPPPDKLLLNSALAGAVGALVSALVLRYLWKRWFARNVLY